MSLLLELTLSFLRKALMRIIVNRLHFAVRTLTRTVMSIVQLELGHEMDTWTTKRRFWMNRNQLTVNCLEDDYWFDGLCNANASRLNGCFFHLSFPQQASHENVLWSLLSNIFIDSWWFLLSIFLPKVYRLGRFRSVGIIDQEYFIDTAKSPF